ncbi:acetate--CoA ligase family protein [Blastococcus saxobsidens]|uniref:Acyl-CoA synthetase (NDP forming) n=1 Tax=Blastococcus saxobsidens (strain DD2) TaxID=1146883 RepID=H6RNQ2_BLASD|nr:acetate--CoA ligase family protein [Blastococcus saxobsidens]CCG05200.1 Acyl-CoA synthetase (NDP forming) [Blastococcus saxobsidens DD2]
MIRTTSARDAALSVLTRADDEGRIGPNEYDAKQIAAEFGLPIPRGVFVPPHQDIRTAAAELAPPLVLKLMSPDVVHKTEFRAVRLGIPDIETLAETRDAMLAEPQLASVRLDGFLVEEMAEASTELVIGGKIDDSFGPVLMLGVGGIFLEVLDDVAFRICPVTSTDILGMLDGLRARRLLDGYRGLPPVDLSKVVAAALALGGAEGLLCELADVISEVDVNPLMVGSTSAVAADVRILGRPSGTATEDTSGASR